MEKLKLETTVEVYHGEDELSDEDKKVLQEARISMRNAYAPYSEFKVGAALLLENGEIIKGNNQENASYPHGLCGERVAMFAAAALYPKTPFKTLAIVSSSKDKDNFEPATPCGGCRQSIAEYEMRFQKPVRLILGGDGDKIYIFPVAGSLLPMSFKFRNEHQNH